MNFLDPRLPDRFWSKCIPEPMSGCWLWLGHYSSSGYGRFRFRGKDGPSHRATYVTARGAIPKGLEIDHLCRQKACCNPAHLEAVTRSVNTLRGDAGRARGAVNHYLKRRTACKRGHEYTAETTKMTERHGRICLICTREVRTRARQKAMQATQGGVEP